ncbi:MAG: glycerol-3-phosphate dehydrogenase [Lentisphaerae bacterium]|jgi:glycerol-3-phosphate dehydrogenase (NAD(P)+)|nr:glycerol-3-phosphate dehydrogenase [Lentisphaerota bacterium]
MSNVTIIGAGMMGTGITRPILDNGHRVRLVGTHLDREIIDSVKMTRMHPTLHRQIPEEIQALQIEDVDSAVAEAPIVVCGVSSFGIPWFAENIIPKLNPGTTVVAITKGLNSYPDGRLEPFPYYLESLRSDLNFVAVGGPCICFELFDRRHTMVCYCGSNMDKVKEIKSQFETGYYHIYPTTDVIGVETGVAMKNAYAMGVSLAVGLAEREKGITDASHITDNCVPGAPDLNPIYNPQAALFAQSCIEMRRLIALLGGNKDFASGLPCAGDLYVTVFGGRTRRLGTLLGRGMPYTEVKKVLSGVTLEAVAIITRVAEAVRIRAKKGETELKYFPLLIHMDSILNQNQPVKLDWKAFGEFY